MGTVRTRLVLAAAVVVTAALVLGAGAGGALAQNAKDTKDAAAKSQEKSSAPKKVIVSGMSSGVLRVPEIAVWSCPGGQMAGCTLVGKVKHGTEVTRYEKEDARGLGWYRVEGAGMSGWVRDTFLETPET